MEKDFGIRFTEDYYATKDEVKKSLNMTSIDSIWDRICEYRSYYTREIGLKNLSSFPYNIVLNNSLLNKFIITEKKMSKELVTYTRLQYLNRNKIENFENSQFKDIASAISSSYDINCSDESLSLLSSFKMESCPVEQLIILRYLKSIKFIQNSFDQRFSLDLIIKIYSLIRGIEINIEDREMFYRKNDSLYSPISSINIEEKLLDLVTFVNTSRIGTIPKACMVYHYINQLEPFEYFNEEVSIILFKFVLSHFDNEFIPGFINIEKIIFQNKKLIDKLLLEVENKLDITYIVNCLVSMLHKAIIEMDKILVVTKEELLSIEEEEIVSSLENIEEKSDKEMLIEPSYTIERPISGVNFEKKVAIQTLPVGLDDKDASLISQHLLEIYPSLKKNQADFYSRHCTIGKYYTISQYKKEENVAYETARTSMDNLAMLGLYKKEQLKNKFVYTPVNLNR